LGADKADDVKDFIGGLCKRKGTLHIAVNGAVSKTGKTAMDKRTLRHAEYQICHCIRKRIGESSAG
jgi:hypothetical protein